MRGIGQRIEQSAFVWWQQCSWLRGRSRETWDLKESDWMLWAGAASVLRWCRGDRHSLTGADKPVWVLWWAWGGEVGGGSVTGEGLYLGQWGDIAHSGIEMPVSNYLCSTWRWSCLCINKKFPILEFTIVKLWGNLPQGRAAIQMSCW